MNIEEAIEKIQELLNLTNWYPKYGYKQAIYTLINYVETMQKEFDRLEGIEDNTVMLKHELEEQTEANKELNKVIIHFKAVINEMAEKLVEAHGWFYSEFDNYTKEDWKEYFSKKVEGK